MNIPNVCVEYLIFPRPLNLSRDISQAAGRRAARATAFAWRLWANTQGAVQGAWGVTSPLSAE